MKKEFKHLGILLLIGMILSSCGKVEEPKFQQLANFSVKKLALQEAVIGFNAKFFNPNSFGVSVKEAAFDVYADSIYIGKFLQPEQVTVNPSAQFSIPMEGTISWQKLLHSNLKNMAGKEVLLKANGAVKIGKGGVYITKNLNYEGKQKLDMGLIKNPAEAAGF